MFKYKLYLTSAHWSSTVLNVRPIVVLLFLNDLPTIPQSCETTIYADETECESASKTEDYKELFLESTINNDLYRVKEYFHTHKLSLNVPRYEFMLVLS